MPFYVGDYLRDTAHLTPAEHGAYVLLLLQGWIGGAKLPPDERRLRTIAKMDIKEWNRSKDTLLAYFQRDGDHLVQKRQVEEYGKAQRMTHQKSVAGTASGEARRRQRQMNGERTAVHTAEQRDTQRLAVPSPSQRKKEDSELKDSSAPKGARDLLWEQGPGIVTRLTGLPDNRARGLLGKLAKVAEDDCQRVLEALNEATRTRPVGEVTAWLLKRVMVRDDGPRDELTGRRVTPMSGGF